MNKKIYGEVTVGQLRKIIRGLPDAKVVRVDVEVPSRPTPFTDALREIANSPVQKTKKPHVHVVRKL